MKQIVFAIIAFLFIGCSGYKPSSYYTKQEISDKVFVHLDINIDNASNSVLIKDAMNEMVVSRFHSSLVSSRDEADTIINISLGSVGVSEIQYDRVGYIKIYRATVSIKVNYKTNKITRNISVSDYYDFSVDSDAVVSDSKRQEAIKIAASKALEEVLSKIAIQTFKKEKEDNNISK